MGTLDDLLLQQQQQPPDDGQDEMDAQSMYALAGGDQNDPRYQDVVPAGAGTSEASRAAMAAADKLRDEVDKGYSTIQQAQQAQANATRDAIRAARQRLLDRKPANDVYWLNIAKALGTPTATGTFGEGLGNAAGAMASGRAALSKEADTKEDTLSKYDTVLSQYGNDPNATSPELLNTQLGLLKLKLQQAGALDVAATRNAGGGTGVKTSLYSQLAAEANDPSLSPEQRAAARAGLAKMTRLPRDPNAAVPLTDDDKKVMEHVANYDEQLQTALSRMSAEKRLAAQAYVYEINPGYTEQSYPVVKQKLHDINDQHPNAPGGRLVAFGGMLPHLELLQHLSTALQGGNVKAINAAKAAMATYFGGNPNAVNLQAAVQLWAPEIERAIGAGQGSETEKQAYRALVTASSKPDVVASTVGQVFLPMTASKIDNILSSFYGALPQEQRERYKGTPEKLLSKEARRIIVRRGLLQDYLWDQGDLGDISATRGTIDRSKPQRLTAPTPRGSATAPTAGKPKGLSAGAQSYLDQVDQGQQ